MCDESSAAGLSARNIYLSILIASGLVLTALAVGWWVFADWRGDNRYQVTILDLGKDEKITSLITVTSPLLGIVQFMTIIFSLYKTPLLRSGINLSLRIVPALLLPLVMRGRLWYHARFRSFGGWLAQTMCSTSAGNCVLTGMILPGSQCYCYTPNGPILGITFSGQGFPAYQQYCWTPAGRIGPLSNNSILAGEYCAAPLPNGSVMQGQACF